MEVMTKDGIKIFSLPDMARCKYCYENPLLISLCPIRNFDDYGSICVPELCEMYTEEDDE